ncbi:hypothetical protein [Burkholderia sp. Ac-20344]|nr:hypothetical protein [Burkholderia sp. Ac-20344]
MRFHWKMRVLATASVALPVDGGLLAGNRVMAQEPTLETFS